MIGRWVKVVQPVQFQPGYNDLMLLSQTVGLQVWFNSGMVIIVSNVLPNLVVKPARIHNTVLVEFMPLC